VFLGEVRLFFKLSLLVLKMARHRIDCRDHFRRIVKIKYDGSSFKSGVEAHWDRVIAVSSYVVEPDTTISVMPFIEKG